MSEQIFLLPDVGEGLVEADIVQWKVAVGDTVTLNQPLVDIETAKATVELPSPYAGVIVKLHGEPGDTMEVHKPLITFEVGGAGAPVSESAPDVMDTPPTEVKEGKREAVLVGYGVADDVASTTRTHRRQGGAVRPAPAPSAPASTPTVAPRSTPPVRLYAKNLGVDLATVSGTGSNGLITRADIDRAAGGTSAPRPRTVVSSGPQTSSRFVGRDLAPWSSGPAEERIPVKGVLRAMADAMVQSSTEAPHAAVWMRVDATKTMELVAALKERPSMAGVRLSPLVVVALAVVDAARHFPGINSSFDAAAGEVIVRRSVNLGIAAATPKGLLVPNIKGADQLDLVGMANELTALVEKARAGTTSLEEMSGTTLTITNVGPFGVDAAIPILPPGTGAIIAIGQIAKAPWVVNDEVVVRHVAEIAMSFDHRQVDGALASAVLAHIGGFLRDPAAAIIGG